MTKETELAHHIHDLKMMVKVANDPKLLWEEMQILGKKAFTLQEKIEELLTELESETKEVSAVQTLFETREKMWDIMNQLADAELKLKERTLKKTSKKSAPLNKEHQCCCCSHEHEDKCCTGKGKKCQKK